MGSGTSSKKDPVFRFWDDYIAHLLNQGIRESVARWYVHRAVQYLQAFPGKRLLTHTAEDVSGYLQTVGKTQQLQGWQFFQTVDAIQNLLQLAKAPVARESESQSTPKLPSAVIREQHAEVLERLRTEIRRRNYSIRTEQTYEAWVCRLIGFFDNRDPVELAMQDIVSFLEDLAVRCNVAASTQNQALNALVFFYQQVLGRSLGELEHFTRAQRPKRLPEEQLQHAQVLHQRDLNQGLGKVSCHYTCNSAFPLSS